MKHQTQSRQSIKIITKGKIEALYIASYPCGSELFKSDYPIVAFAGRSNCGKSSLLNCLTGNSKLARVSSTPGRTRTVNIFRINRKLIFADLPGYGYSKVPTTTKKFISESVEQFLMSNSENLILVSLLDIRVPPSNDDLELKGWSDSYGIPVIYVLTKCDKLSRNQRAAALKKIYVKMGIHDNSNDKPVLFSSVTGEGKPELWKSIENKINSFIEE